MLPLVIMKDGMKKHLTDASVRRIKPPKAGTLEIFDLGYSGLALRVGHGGAKSFEVFYRLNGKLKRESIGRWPEVSLATARETWRKTREAIARGEAPQREGKTKADLFESVVEEWLKRDQSSNKPSSFYQTTRVVAHDLLPVWSGRPITGIGKKDIISLIDGIMDRGAAVKANRVFAHLHRFFKWCISREIIATHPMNGLERPGAPASRERVLNDEELVKVWNGAGKVPVFGDVVKLLILTGARKEEIGALRWDEIQGDHILLANGRTKNGKAHIIPLTPAARALIEAMPRVGDYVFTLNGKKTVTGWSRAKENLDKATMVSDWRIHDLRRTVATNMQKMGVTLQTVEAVLGHVGGSRSGIVGVYQLHDFADEKRAALEAWGKHVEGLVS